MRDVTVLQVKRPVLGKRTASSLGTRVMGFPELFEWLMGER